MFVICPKYIQHWFLDLSLHWNLLEDLLKHRWLDPIQEFLSQQVGPRQSTYGWTNLLFCCQTHNQSPALVTTHLGYHSSFMGGWPVSSSELPTAPTYPPT